MRVLARARARVFARVRITRACACAPCRERAGSARPVLCSGKWAGAGGRGPVTSGPRRGKGAGGLHALATMEHRMEAAGDQAQRQPLADHVQRRP